MSQIQDLVKKGQSFMNAGKFDEALGFFEQALLLNQNDPDLWNHKGVALRSLGRYEESMECFNKSLEIEPRDRHAS
ncbi:MAG: tetratricopeptide repeat protein [Nitrosopumilus sp.]|nr:tetratricopeptide repeat protein [Nitrosopumilus sp.]